MNWLYILAVVPAVVFIGWLMFMLAMDIIAAWRLNTFDFFVMIGVMLILLLGIWGVVGLVTS